MFYFLAYFRCHPVFTWQITLAYGGVGLWEVVVGGGGWLGVEVFFLFWGGLQVGVGGGWGWVVWVGGGDQALTRTSADWLNGTYNDQNGSSLSQVILLNLNDDYMPSSN